MTLVLKSNVVANSAISDKHGVIAVKDWKLMLDFENQQYLTKSGGISTQVDANAYVESTNTNPIVYTKEDVYQVIPDNSLRLSLNRSKKSFGLLEEGSVTNFYFPSSAPVSKKINLPMGSYEYPYIVTMRGSGSVSVTGAAIYNATAATATEDASFIFWMNSSGEVDVTVTGNVSFLAINRHDHIGAGFFSNSLVNTNLSSWDLVTGVTKLKQAKIPEVISSSNFTVLFQLVDNDFNNIPYSGTTYRAIIELINGSKDISIIKRKTSPANEEIAIRMMDTVETITTLSGESKINTIAISSGVDGLMFAVNGIVTQPSQILKGFTVADILIGSSTKWLGSFNSKAQGVFTKFVVYDRQLSFDELGSVTKSFM